MDYQRHYDLLVIKAQSRPIPPGYTETHHIVPRCLGGGNEAGNLVVLTAREHCLAHLLLAKIYGGKLWYAANMMANRFGMKSRAYSIAREQHAENFSGDKNHRFGKKHSAESRQKLSEANSGDKHPMFGRTGDKCPHFKGSIVATNLKTNEGILYFGKKELIAAGFVFGRVYDCINGKFKQHKGHTFKRIPLK